MTLALLGWMVVHSLWQATLVAGVTALAIGALPDAKARTRYAIGCASLMVMLVSAVITGVTATIVHDARHQLLYAFDGALILPAIVPRGNLILRLAAIAWLAGVTWCLLRVAIEWRRAWLLRREAQRDPDSEVLALVEALRTRMAIRGSITVRTSRRASVPMVLGWRPIILLPPPTERLTTPQLASLLAHEIEHVRRRDYAANLAQLAVDVLLFHHPAARWVSRRVRTEREYCCDDAAVRVAGDAREYSRALAALEDARSDCRLAVAAASGTLLDRIHRVVGHPRPVLTAARGVLALTIATAIGAMLLTVTANLPPPDVPAGVRMRRPGPVPAGVIMPNPPLKMRRSR